MSKDKNVSSMIDDYENTNIPRPYCRNHDDCFALYKKRRCRCLINTDFGSKGCPFYKRDINEIRGREYV